MTKKRRSTPSGVIRQPLMVDEMFFGSEDLFLHLRETEKQIMSLDPVQLNDMHMRGSVFSDGSPEEDGVAVQEFGQYGYMLQRVENIAVMDISGTLVPKESWLNRYYGRVSYEEIRNATIAAAEAGVTGILANVDTGGGAATGIMELSDFWKEVDKQIPIYTYTGTNMLSGGYWIGALGRKIFTSQMASLGSIGVITAHFSYARALKENGIDVTMMRAGEFKALGSPYEKLDDKAKGVIEEKLNKTYGLFTSHVSELRGIPVQTLIDTAAEGRTFFGDDAISVGLADKLLSFDGALKTVIEKTRKVQVAGPVTKHSTKIGGNDMKRALNAAGVSAVASGMPQEEALKDPVLSVEASEADDAAAALAAETAAAAAVAAETTEGDAASPAAKPNASVEPDSQTVNILDKFLAVSTELAQVRAEHGRAKAELEELKSNEQALMKIAVDTVNRMGLPLGLAQCKIEDVSPASIIGLHHRTLSAFNSKFRPGQQTEVAADVDLSPAAAKPAQARKIPATAVKL